MAGSLRVLALAVLYWLPIRRWFVSWGTTTTDLTWSMMGDAAVAIACAFGRRSAPGCSCVSSSRRRSS
jgi:hypothetical protein